MNTTLRNKLLVGTALVATGVFMAGAAQAQNVITIDNNGDGNYTIDQLTNLNLGGASPSWVKILANGTTKINTNYTLGDPAVTTNTVAITTAVDNLTYTFKSDGSGLRTLTLAEGINISGAATKLNLTFLNDAGDGSAFNVTHTGTDAINLGTGTLRIEGGGPTGGDATFSTKSASVTAGIISLDDTNNGDASITFDGQAAQTINVGNIKGQDANDGVVNQLNKSTTATDGLTFNGNIGEGSAVSKVVIGGAANYNTRTTFKGNVTTDTAGAGIVIGDTNNANTHEVIFDATAASRTITGAISGGGASDVVNLIVRGGDLTKTVTFATAMGNDVDLITIEANTKLISHTTNATTVTLNSGSVLQTGAVATSVADINGPGTFIAAHNTILTGIIGGATAATKLANVQIDQGVTLTPSNNVNANVVTLAGTGTGILEMTIGKNLTANVVTAGTDLVNGKGTVTFTDAVGTSNIVGNLGTATNPLAALTITNTASAAELTTTGSLNVKSITIGQADTLSFIGTTPQVVSGTIKTAAANQGTINIGNGTTTSNVTFSSALGETGTKLSSAKVFNKATATFNDNVFLSSTLQNDGTITVAQGKTVTADGGFTAGAAVGTYNLTIGTTTGGVDNSATLADTVGAIDYNLLNGTTANGAKLNLTQGTGVIADNQAFKIIDGTGAVTNLGTTLVKVDNTFALFDFKVRTGDGTLLAGTNNSDVIAIATHNATAGGVINVSANQSTANAILGITAAQYAAADAKFKLLYDTVTRASTANINNALEAVRPELHMAGVAAATSVTTQTTSLANTQLASLRDGSESGMYAGSASGGLRAWLQGFGQTADQSDRKGIAGYDADSYGVAVGFDTSDLAQNWVLGLMFAYGNSDIDSKSVNRTTTDIDSYQIGVYSSYNFDSATYLTGQFGYIWMNNEQTRRNVLPGIDAKGDFDSYSVYARLEAGRGYNVGGDAVVTPKFLVNYQHYNADSYRETLAGGAGLNVSADSINIFELGVGADVKWNLQQADGAVFQPKFSAGVRHDLIGDEFKTTNSFIGVPAASFTTRGADPAQTTYNLGAALTYFSAANWELSAAYDYEARSDFNSHTGSLKASFKF